MPNCNNKPVSLNIGDLLNIDDLPTMKGVPFQNKNMK